MFGRELRDVRLWRADFTGLLVERPPVATVPPFERVAADLRRVRRMRESLPKGTSWVRVSGLNRAYDDLLCMACAQLHVDTQIRELPEGDRRHLERARVEYLLSENGLLL
jgi:hypothetical protein